MEFGKTGPNHDLPYALVRLDADVLARVAAEDDIPRFSTKFMGGPARGGGIGVGDLVGVTIFESGAGGLFIPAEPGTRTGNSVTFPNQQVDNAGNILVPYAGAVHVAGLSPQAVGQTIEARLSGRALDPQAIVSVTERRSNAISVTGDVSSSTHFSLDPGGERLLGAIARAGGPKFPGYETTVTLQRGDETESAFLSEVMRDPTQNLQLHPGDSLYVSHTPRYYLALGALGPGAYLGLINRRLSFDDTRIALADALAKVGGLEDDRANSRAVFLYRTESRATLAKLGNVPDTMPEKIPTIYMVDLSEPAGYFYAQRMMMRNEDLLFVSNAPATDLTKFLNLLVPISQAVYNFKQ